jgi:hypothetical protein
MKKLIIIPILILASIVCFGQIVTKPIKWKFLDKVMTDHSGEFKLRFSCDYYINPVNTKLPSGAVMVKKYNGIWYSNYPYVVKIDTIKKVFRVYAGEKMVWYFWDSERI